MVIRIKSVSDVITNSSTEVFVNKVDDKFKEVVSKLGYLSFDYINTEEDLKEIIRSCINNDYRSYGFLQNIFEADFFKCDYDGYDVVNNLRFTIEELKHDNVDEIYEWYKPLFEQLIGYAYLMVEDNNISHAEFIDLEYLHSHGIGGVDRI